VQRRQAEKFAARDQQIVANRAQGWYQGTETAAQAPPPEEAPSQPDTIAQLKQLGELRDSGVLTEEEFAAQKAKILGT
jgi:hypothetical protein